MKNANSHKKYGEGERLLFHGTSTKNIEGICRHNFDMRVSGVNGTDYGQGKKDNTLDSPPEPVVQHASITNL